MHMSLCIILFKKNWEEIYVLLILNVNLELGKDSRTHNHMQSLKAFFSPSAFLPKFAFKLNRKRKLLCGVME